MPLSSMSGFTFRFMSSPHKDDFLDYASSFRVIAPTVLLVVLCTFGAAQAAVSRTWGSSIMQPESH